MGSLEPAAGNDELDTFERLLALLDEHSADYRVLEHPPEGRTEAVSRLRGNDLGQAAKCIVLLVKIGKKVKRYVLAVVPGDRRVDFSAVKDLFGATYVGFADAPTAERLARSVAGTVLPFAFDPRLEVVVDPDLLAVSTVYFNAARLDRSLALKTVDFKRIAQPRVARLAGRRALSSPAQRERCDREPRAARLARHADKSVGINAVEELHMTNPDLPYDINLNAKYSHLQLIDIPAEAAAHEPWFNQTLATVNDAVVRLGVIEGEFHWHKHDDQDELFLVLEGELLIDLEDRDTVVLAHHHAYTVPRGVPHRTRALRRTEILMIEAAGVTPTGD